MGLTEIQKAIETNETTTKQESGVWSVNVRLDMADERQALIAKKIKALVKSSGLGGGPLVVELLDEILKQVEVPLDEV